jgi:DNA-binding NarL/FixJ family response regulator
MIRILIAEDHGIVRQGLRALLAQQSDFLIVGEATTGLDVLRLANELSPDLLLLDLMLPEVSGLEVTRQLCQAHPRLRILILSMHADIAYMAQAFQSGAAGYILKGSDSAELIQAIRTIIQGGRYLNPPWTEADLLQQCSQPATVLMDRYNRLTPREREVLSLAAHGLSSSQIGGRLSISPRTVEVHRANLMRKLDLHSHAELLHYAMERGILLPTPACELPKPPGAGAAIS